MRKLALIIAMLIFWQPVVSVGQEQVSQRGKIIYAASAWPPYVTIAEDGTPSGLFVDLLTELFIKKLGLDVEFLHLPWKRAQYALKNGVADMTITLPLEERLLYAVPSNIPLINLSLHIFTQAGHPQLAEIEAISSVTDIKKLGLIPVTNIGNGWHKNEIDSQGIQTEYVPSEENAFQMVASKRADITIEPLCAGYYLIDKLGLRDKVVATRASFGPMSFHLLISKKSQFYERMEEIDKALTELVFSGRVQAVIDSFEETQAGKSGVPHQ